jgi:hypothetical protein
MTATDFLDSLARDVPESEPVVIEHLENNDGILLHLLTADLRRFTMRPFDTGQMNVLDRLLASIDIALRDGTDDVQNAIAVSFVEDTGWWDPTTQPFIEVWPPALRAEVDRQRGQRQ